MLPWFFSMVLVVVDLTGPMGVVLGSLDACLFSQLPVLPLVQAPGATLLWCMLLMSADNAQHMLRGSFPGGADA
jgi:hypothetical protein